MAEATAPQPTQQAFPELERRGEWSLLFIVGFVLASLVVHLVGFTGLQAYARLTANAKPLNTPIEMMMVTVEPPKPPPPPPEEVKPPPPPPPKPKIKVRPPPVKVAEVVKPPPVIEDAPPPPIEEAPKEPPKPVPLVVGISLSSTTAAGGFAAPVGNTAYGKTERTAVEPSQVKAYRAPRYVPAYQVDRQPSVRNEFKIPYPSEAKRNGVEGNVVLKISIDAEGNVTGVKLLNGPGYGLNEAALAAVKRFRFTPAIKGGEAVSTEIPYTYTFLLD